MGGSESRRSARVGAAKPRVEEKPRISAGDLETRSRDELRALAKQLGLTGVSKLNKDALLARVQEAMRAVPAPVAAAPVAAASQTAPGRTAPGQLAPSVEELEPEAPGASDADAAGEPAATAKLDLGPAAAAAEKPTEHIPWSYGQDRVTAAAIDPQRLYVYWEVTDPAVAKARAGLGEGGAGAWLNLRVYDTTGRIFDGTNAHSYFDHGLSREDRQWFFHIGKPTSTAYAEIGMKSAAGHFVRIARSGRVDFPRAEPLPPDAAEWLTVRISTGEAQPAGRGGGPAPVPPGLSPPPRGAIPVFDLGSGADAQDGLERRIWELLHGDGRRIEWQQLLGGAGWFELEGHLGWEGPGLVTSWQAGPFTHPVSVEPPSREEWQGQSFAFRVGDVTHVVHGPWQVVIRNLGAFSERAELARWEIFRSWVASGGAAGEVTVRTAATLPGGASEALGASERRWLAGSELRLGGASEVFRLGASELRMRGASETLFAGASEWVTRGASERRLGGASEVHLRGGSEDRLGGSEHRLATEREGTSLGYPKVEG